MKTEIKMKMEIKIKTNTDLIIRGTVSTLLRLGGRKCWGHCLVLEFKTRRGRMLQPDRLSRIKD